MRRNFSGPGGRYENLDEPSPLDLSRDPADNIKDLLYQITTKEMMSTAKRMGYINNFTKLIQNVGEIVNFGYSLEDIIKCLMLPLVSAAKELRAAGLRAFRHLFSDEKTLSKMLDFRIDIFIVRSMDMVHAFEVERVQALRFIRKVIAVSPQLCPMSMAATLVSIGNDEGDDADRLRKACVATLCELAIKNITTASYCGGINTIIRNVLDSQMQKFNESLMATLLYLLSSLETRPYVRSDVGLEVNHNSILAPKTSENDSGTLISGLESPSSFTKSLATDGARCVSAQDLYNLLKPESESKVLILDCRPHGMFLQNRIKCSCCISIPAELLDQGVSVGSIERRLPEATRKIWKMRGEKEFVILMDESTKVAEITPESRIQRLKDVIFTFDSYSSLKREPLFLDGGFHSWLWHYPSLALKAELPKVQSKPKAVTPVDLSSLDYPELPDEKVSPPPLPPSPETGSINSSLQYPVLLTVGLENVNGPLVSPKGSIEHNNSVPSSLPATFQPNANIPTPGPLPGGNTFSAGSSPDHKPGFPSLQSQTDAMAPRISETRSSQFGSPQMEPVNIPSSQPGLPSLQPVVTLISTCGQQLSVGMTPQTVIPNPAGPRAPGSPPNTTVPHPSSKPVFQPTPNSASPVAPTTQTSSSSVPVPKPSAVPFSSPSSMPSAQPGFSPSQATSSQSASISKKSAPEVQPAGVSSTSSLTSQVHSTAPLQVTQTISPSSSTQGPKVSSKSSTYLQGPGGVATSASGTGAKNVNPGNQPQVPSMDQGPHGDSQVPGQSSLSTAQCHQVTPKPILKADQRDNSSGSQASVNAGQVPPPESALHSPQKPAQVGPSGTTRQPGSDSAQPIEQKASKTSQQPVPKMPAANVTTPGLPPGWERVESEGKVYYKDHNTQTTHWQPPTTGTSAAAPQSVGGAERLPPGWERVESEGKIYYKDNNTKTTHWQPPATAPQSSGQNQQQRQQQQHQSAPQSSGQNQQQRQQQQHQSAPQSSGQNQQQRQQQQQHQSALKRQSSVDRPTLRRSNSSPNLKKLSDQGTSGPKRPIVDRLSKPDSEETGPVRPTINRTAKPLSANQLDSFNPSYGGLGSGLTGLRNLGNTCYMNSVVQCLSSVAPLSAFFLSGAYKDDLNRSSRDGTRGELAENFSVLVRVLHSGQFKFVSPGDFKRTVGKFKSQFSGYDQQDSQELLAFLMDGLQEDLNKVKDKPYLKAPADDLDPQTAAKIAWENHKKRNRSIMVELFDGLFMSTVRCLVCHKESRTFDTFSNLTLPLPSNASRCTLQDCLALFTKPEKMSGDDKWFCPKCRQRREASKTIQIWRLPAILVVHLKRFQYEGMWRQKLQTSVSFPMSQLDVSSSVVGPKSSTRYNLHAVSNHYGTMHGGHYTAFCKNVYDKKWYKFDDQYVTEMSPREVVTSAGYLLFYTSFDFQPPKYLIKS